MTTNLLGLVVLLVGTPLNVIVTVMLWRRSMRYPELRVLRERAVTASLVLLTVVVFGLIFVNNDTLPPPLDVVITKWVTRVVLLLLAIVPALYWLLLYRSASREP